MTLQSISLLSRLQDDKLHIRTACWGDLASVIESVSRALRREAEAALMIFVVSAEFVVQWVGGVGVLGEGGMGIIHVSPGSGGYFEASSFTLSHYMSQHSSLPHNLMNNDQRCSTRASNGDDEDLKSGEVDNKVQVTRRDTDED